MGRSVAIDLVGNSVVTGGFNSSYIVFGSDTLFNSGSAGMEDFFLAKLDAFGSPIWAIQAVGVGAETGNGVAIDALGNITVVGTYTDTTVVFGSDTLPGPYGTRAFIARYDASGNELWAKTFSGTYQNQGQAVCNDTFGNIFFTGSYRGASVTFDTLAPFASSFANDNAYLIKMDPSGNALWGKSIGGNYLDEGTGVACDPSGNVHLCNKDGLIILDSKGKRLALIQLETIPANICWGGPALKDLFITARKNIFLIKNLLR